MAQHGDELLAQAQRIAPLTARQGEESVLLAKAQGCRVFDADNVAYLDFVGGGGSNLLGYANQYVLDAARRAAALGLGAGFHCAAEVELVELLGELNGDLSPWLLTSSEAQAWELALRWCRRTTGRQRIVVFDGNRRGAVEAFQAAAMGPLGISQPLVAGVLSDVARLVRVVPWGDVEALSAVLGEVGVDVAAVILDPVAAQFGVLRPPAEFLNAVEQMTHQTGAFLVLDETLTGFRVARGGAAEKFGVASDLAVFGGALGGGVSEVGGVAWARPLAAAPGDDMPPPPSPTGVHAAIATLSVLRNDAVHQRLEERSAQLEAGIAALAERFGRPLQISRVGSLFALAFSRSAIVDGNSFARVDQETWARFQRSCRESGVLLPVRSPAAAFISHAHGVKDVEQALAGMESALRKMQKEDEA